MALRVPLPRGLVPPTLLLSTNPVGWYLLAMPLHPEPPARIADGAVLLTDPDPSEPSDTQVTRALAAVQAAGLTPPPNGWRSVRVREDRHGDMPVTIVRFQPDGYRLGGPHTSVVTGPGG